MAAREFYLEASKPGRAEMGVLVLGKVFYLEEMFKMRCFLRRMIKDSEENSLRLRDHTYLLGDTIHRTANR